MKKGKAWSSVGKRCLWGDNPVQTSGSHFPAILGRLMKKFLVSPEKGGIILKPTQIADLGNGLLLFKKLPCHQ